MALVPNLSAQFTPQTYPDPRTDPVACKIALPGPVCDPSEILTAEERNSLMDNIRRVSVLDNVQVAMQESFARPHEVTVTV